MARDLAVDWARGDAFVSPQDATGYSVYSINLEKAVAGFEVQP